MADGYLEDAILPNGWGTGYTQIKNDGDNVIIHRVEDATELDEANRELRKMEMKTNDNFNLAARIPLSLYFSLPPHIRDDDHELLKWIERAKLDGMNFKTTEKRLV